MLKNTNSAYELYSKFNPLSGWMWWDMPMFPALRRLRQSDFEFKVRMPYSVKTTLCSCSLDCVSCSFSLSQSYGCGTKNLIGW